MSSQGVHPRPPALARALDSTRQPSSNNQPVMKPTILVTLVGRPGLQCWLTMYHLQILSRTAHRELNSGSSPNREATARAPERGCSASASQGYLQVERRHGRCKPPQRNGAASGSNLSTLGLGVRSEGGETSSLCFASPG